MAQKYFIPDLILITKNLDVLSQIIKMIPEDSNYLFINFHNQILRIIIFE